MNFRPSNLISRSIDGCPVRWRNWSPAILAGFLAFLGFVAAAMPAHAQVVPPPISAQIMSQAVRDATQPKTEKPAGPSTPAKGPNTTRPPSGDTGVETHYVRDESGELVPILNLSYEDFVRLYQIDRGLNAAQQPPQYSIENVTVTGEVRDERAELDIELQIKTLSNKTVRMPLRLNGAILSEPARYEGKGEHVLAASEQDGGYVSWLKGAANSVHKTRLKVIVPLLRVGNESRLNIALPTANASTLKITIPEERATATTSAPARIVGQKRLEGGLTELSVAGAKGDFQLGWTSQTEEAVAQSPLLMEATGVIQVRVKGPGAVSTQARIRVSSSGREMDSIKIKLPVGSKPIAVEDPRYTTEFVTPASSPDNGESPDAQRPIAIVKFTEPTRGPVDVQLAVEQSGSGTNAQTNEEDAAKEDKKTKRNTEDKTANAKTANAKPRTASNVDEVDVLGFEVVDALRHFGTVSLIAEGDWLVRTTASNDLRRLGKIPDAIAQEGLVAAFEYYRQPASLPIKVLAKETRVNVDPTYVLDVQQDAVELTAILDCQVLGAPAFSLSVDMSGWDVQEVGQPNLVQEDSLRLSEVTPLEIPLALAMRGEFQIRVKARRPIPVDANTLQFRLPTVRDASATAATVVVTPADNLVLTSRQGTMRLFDPEPVPDGLPLPTRTRAPLCYRFRGDPGSANLNYEFGRRARLTTVTVNSDVRVEKNRTSVEQRFEYNVLNQPLDFVTLRVPPSLTEDARKTGKERFRVSIDGEVLTSDDITRERDTDVEINEPEGNEIWRIRLRPARLGSFRLQTQFELPWSLTDIMAGVQTAPYDVTLPNTVPLARPAESESTGTTVRIGCPKQFSAALSAYDPWPVELTTTPASDLTSLTEYQATTCPRSVALEVRPLERKRSQAAVIDGLFAQTWLTADQRQDRIAVTMSNATSPLRLQLPGFADAGNLLVLVDGQKVATRAEGADGIVIDLPAAINGRVEGTTAVELAFRYATRPDLGKMQFELPSFAGVDWVQRFYWQVVLPQDEHLLTHSKQVTSEHIWKRRGFAWYRTPGMSQLQLESLVGASSQTAPGTSNNHYLFAGFGAAPILEIQTASRRWLLLVSSGFALGLALLWQLVPWTAHRWILIPLAIIIGATAWLYPGPAVIVAQAAVLGLAVAVFARMLDWTINRRRSDTPTYKPKTQSQSSPSATILRGSSIAKPRSTDALSVRVTGQR